MGIKRTHCIYWKPLDTSGIICIMYNKETGTCSVCGHKPGECDFQRHNLAAKKVNKGYFFDPDDLRPVDTSFTSDNPILQGPHINEHGEKVITVASIRYIH